MSLMEQAVAPQRLGNVDFINIPNVSKLSILFLDAAVTVMTHNIDKKRKTKRTYFIRLYLGCLVLTEGFKARWQQRVTWFCHLTSAKIRNFYHIRKPFEDFLYKKNRTMSLTSRPVVTN